MDRIWAPWRMRYIKKLDKKRCVFCRAAKSKNDRANFVVLRTKYAFVILNIFPYNNGHLMVAPFRHKASLRLLRGEEVKEMMLLVNSAQAALEKILKPQGYNIGINEGVIAGAGFANHIHIHIVPRWKGDTNFMPIVASAKVIPQSLDDLYAKLKKLLK